jgi:sec-independent protein translocase protein TatB
MFGIDSGEILIIAVVALVVIGPKDLPRAMRAIGNFVGRARGMARHFRAGFDTMMRESELEEMEKKWQADNERIMREHPAAPAGLDRPAAPADTDWGRPPDEEPRPPRPASGPPAPRALPGASPAGNAAPPPPPRDEQP